MSSISTVPLYVNLPIDLKEELERVAAKEDRTMTAVVCRALRQYIEERDGNGQETGEPE